MYIQSSSFNPLSWWSTTKAPPVKEKENQLKSESPCEILFHSLMNAPIDFENYDKIDFWIYNFCFLIITEDQASISKGFKELNQCHPENVKVILSTIGRLASYVKEKEPVRPLVDFLNLEITKYCDSHKIKNPDDLSAAKASFFRKELEQNSPFMEFVNKPPPTIEKTSARKHLEKVGSKINDFFNKTPSYMLVLLTVSTFALDCLLKNSIPITAPSKLFEKVISDFTAGCLTAINPVQILSTIAISIFMSLALYSIGIEDNGIQTKVYHQVLKLPLKEIMFIAGIIAPIREELFFRGFLQGSANLLLNTITIYGSGYGLGLNDTTISRCAQLFSAAAFGLLHINQGLTQSLNAGVTALCTKIRLYEEKGIFASIGCHMAWNSVWLCVLAAIDKPALVLNEDFKTYLLN